MKKSHPWGMRDARRLRAALLAAALLCAAGCGRAGEVSDGSSGGAGAGVEAGSLEAEASPTSEGGDGTAAGPGVSQKPGGGSAKASPTPKAEVASPTPAPTPKVEKASFSLGRQYSNANRTIRALGLKEYEKLEGDAYTDRPRKGRVFLVLFLEISNASEKDDYVNYNYLSAKIDGKRTEHTFLVNDPRGYPTIFEHVPAGQSIGGFIVWEAPRGWRRLDVRYDGWQYEDGVSVRASFTPKDLSSPRIYDAGDFGSQP